MALDQWSDNELITKTKMNKMVNAINENTTLQVGVSSSTVTYQLSSSGTTTPTGAWSSSVLAQTTTLPYLWTKTVITYSNSTTTTMYSVSSKGDTGTVDNVGLINSQAFQSLQNQVNNSAVGTNLLINTSSSATNGMTSLQGDGHNISGVYSRTDSYEQMIAPSSSEFYYRFMPPTTNNLYGLTPGETYTLSGSGSHTSGELKFRAEYRAGGGWISLGDPSDLGIPISDGSVFTPFSYTFTIPVGATSIYFSLENYDYTAGGLFRFKNMKFEKGSVATDWCPNPAEILTQADYAKIQAAIVALGGSLK